MKNWLKFSIIPFCVLLNSSYGMDHNHAQLILNRIGEHVDRKVVDLAIVSTCATTCANVGYQLNLYALEWYYAKPAYGLGMRSDDDIGYYVGLLAGTEIGYFLVTLRHKITDPLFPAMYNFGIAGLGAGKTFVENTVVASTGYLCTKLTGYTQWFKNYAGKQS